MLSWSSLGLNEIKSSILAMFIMQATAEAQEVTIARAIELKHNPGLVSALAHETSKMFTTAADNLHTLDQKQFGHWRQGSYNAFIFLIKQYLLKKFVEPRFQSLFRAEGPVLSRLRLQLPGGELAGRGQVRGGDPLSAGVHAVLQQGGPHGCRVYQGIVPHTDRMTE